MAKNSVTDWSETPGDNTDVGGTNIDEGCAPSNINDAIRKVMAQIKSFFKSSVFRLRDGTDQTKLLAVDLASITTATTRTLAVQDKDGTVALTSDISGGAVRVATTANITIATALNVGDAIDGVTLADGDLVLVKDQTSGATNGVYVAGATPVRADSFSTWADFLGATVSVAEGTANAGTLWISSAPKAGTLGTTSFAFISLTPPKRFTSTQQTITLGGTLTLAHSLGAEPFDYDAFLVCQSADLGYSPGDVIKLTSGASGDSSDTGITMRADATNIYLVAGLLTIRIIGATGGNFGITVAKWKILVKAWI